MIKLAFFILLGRTGGEMKFSFNEVYDWADFPVPLAWKVDRGSGELSYNLPEQLTIDS